MSVILLCDSLVLFVRCFKFSVKNWTTVQRFTKQGCKNKSTNGGFQRKSEKFFPMTHSIEMINWTNFPLIVSVAYRELKHLGDNLVMNFVQYKPVSVESNIQVIAEDTPVVFSLLFDLSSFSDFWEGKQILPTTVGIVCAPIHLT